MSTPNKAGDAGRAAAFPIDTDRLRRALTDAGSIAESALAEISGVAALALAYMETPDAYRNTENIAQALLAIKSAADDAHNCVGVELEEVGIRTADEAWRRRLDARFAARPQDAADGKAGPR